MNSKHVTATTISTFALLVAAACGGESGSSGATSSGNSGQGGQAQTCLAVDGCIGTGGQGTSTTTGNTGGGSTNPGGGGQGTGGGNTGGKCNPYDYQKGLTDYLQGYNWDCINGPNCECLPVKYYTDAETCTSLEENFPGICANGVGTCGNGTFQCGRDLPSGMNYELPGKHTLDFAANYYWLDDDNQEINSTTEYDLNGYVILTFVGASNDFLTRGLVVSGYNLYANMANKGQYSYCEGTISTDGKTIEYTCGDPSIGPGTTKRTLVAYHGG